MALRVALVASLASLAPAAALHATGVADRKLVKVEFYGEAGWPECAQFTGEAVKSTMNAEGVPDILDFTFVPFGNSYYVNDATRGKCHTEGNTTLNATEGMITGDLYNADARKCFSTMCGAASSKPQDCYAGELLCQHGKQECDANLYMRCAQDQLDNKFARFFPYAACVEDHYMDGTADEVAEKCAKETKGIDFATLRGCLTGDRGKELVRQGAMVTPEHEGVPWVLVDGVQLEDPYTLLEAVCSAFTGQKPRGCSRQSLRSVKRISKNRAAANLFQLSK